MRISKLKLVALATTLLVVGVAISACGDDDDDTAAAGGESAEGLQVGYSSKGTDEFMLILQEQAVEQLEAQGMEPMEPVSSEGDPGKQLSDIQTLVASGAEALMLVPTDSSAVKPALDFLEEESIPSVAIDTAPVGAEVSMVVMADNVGMGEEACQQIGAELKGEGQVLEMQGDLRTSTGRDRSVGFKDCMDAEFPDIEVTQRSTDWLADKASEIARTEVSTNKDLDAIYMASDTVMLQPVLSALSAAGRDAKVGEPGHVFLVSVDGSPFGLKQIREGNLDALLSQPLDLYAEYGAQYLKEAAEGAEFEFGPTDHDSEIVDLEGNPTDLLPATLVTKENADDPSLWGNTR